MKKASGIHRPEIGGVVLVELFEYAVAAVIVLFIAGIGNVGAVCLDKPVRKLQHVDHLTMIFTGVKRVSGMSSPV